MNYRCKGEKLPKFLLESKKGCIYEIERWDNPCSPLFPLTFSPSNNPLSLKKAAIRHLSCIRPPPKKNCEIQPFLSQYTRPCRMRPTRYSKDKGRNNQTLLRGRWLEAEFSKGLPPLPPTMADIGLLTPVRNTLRALLISADKRYSVFAIRTIIVFGAGSWRRDSVLGDNNILKKMYGVCWHTSWCGRVFAYGDDIRSESINFNKECRRCWNCRKKKNQDELHGVEIGEWIG